MKIYYKIVNVHESRAHPGIIYAELVEVETGYLSIGATSEYIFTSIRERDLNVVNVIFDKWGNCHLI